MDGSEDLVAIGIAGDPMEGGMIREFLRAEGIHCMIQGEQHRSMLQMLGAFIELRILVPRSRAEEAATLLAAFREELAGEQAQPGGEEEDEDDEDDEDTGDEDEAGRAPRPVEAAALADWRKDPELVRRVRGARLLSLMLPGFGVGHFSVGAIGRAFLLLSAWPLAFWLRSYIGFKAGALIPASALIDFLATPAAMTAVMRRRRRDALPQARIQK